MGKLLILVGAIAMLGCAEHQKMQWNFQRLPKVARARPAMPPPTYDDGIYEIDGGTGGGLEREPTHKARSPLDDAWPDQEPVTITVDNSLVLQWPLPATGVNSLFGPRTDPKDGSRRFHYGIDLQASYGDPVRAAAAGKVVHAGWYRGHGRMVTIQHAKGYRSSYSHLSQIMVREGQRIGAAATVGKVGNSGRSTGPHLHLEIRRHGAYLDPLDVLGSKR